MKKHFSKVAVLALASTMLMSVAAIANDNNDFSHLDPKGIVPKKPLQQAIAYFKKNRNSFSNQKSIIVIDFTRHSSKKRFFVINLSSGAVEPHLTSHGRGSDVGGYAKKFSNEAKSHMSSIGFYRTLGSYSGKHGYSMRLQGLSSTNSNALARAIVVHPANYVSDAAGSAGRSHGCPALDPKYSKSVIDRTKGGTLMYIWSGQG